MPLDPSALATLVHASGRRLVIAVTGGGSQAISSLLSVPGASRSIVEAAVPHSPEALTAWLGARPEQFCDPRTARAMAMAGYWRAQAREPGGGPLVGIGCTASLASDRPKQGAHRVHAAWQSEAATACISLELAKGRRSRSEEEALTATLILNLVAEACGVAERPPLELFPGEEPHATHFPAPADWQNLWAARALRVAVSGGGQPSQRVIFPGAFNPLHAGHRQMAEVAAQLLGERPAFELSIVNVDKPPLDFLEIAARAAQFAGGESVWLTRAPRFRDKARLFPGATFVIGADTAVRIADPRYYRGAPEVAAGVIGELADQGCRFLVYGRVFGGAFRQLDDLALPPQLRDLCEAVPEVLFRDDVSSTQLRQEG